MLLSLALIGLGLVLLVLGGECLLRGAVGLATLARLTPAVIGLTVVAAGTSVPELAVSAIATLQGKPDITVGNVVGSNIFNIAFILGLAALIRPLVISGNTIRLEYPVLAVVTLLCVAVCDHGAVLRLDAILFIVVYIVFIAYMVSLVRKQLTADESKQLVAETRELALEGTRPPRFLWCTGLVLGGVVLLTVGAHVTVTGAVEIGRLSGLSERIIGLTIIAAGTGLPELVTSLVSSIRGRDDIAIGNVIGSNLFNILGILGMSGLIAPLPIAPEIAASDNWWMLGVTVLLFPMMYTGLRINRLEGGGLLMVYVVYVVLLLKQPGDTGLTSRGQLPSPVPCRLAIARILEVVKIRFNEDRRIAFVARDEPDAKDRVAIVIEYELPAGLIVDRPYGAVSKFGERDWRLYEAP